MRRYKRRIIMFVTVAKSVAFGADVQLSPLRGEFPRYGAVGTTPAGAVVSLAFCTLLLRSEPTDCVGAGRRLKRRIWRIWRRGSRQAPSIHAALQRVCPPVANRHRRRQQR